MKFSINDLLEAKEKLSKIKTIKHISLSREGYRKLLYSDTSFKREGDTKEYLYGVPCVVNNLQKEDFEVIYNETDQ